MSRLLGALRSGNSAIYLGMVLKLLSPLTKALESVLSSFDNQKTLLEGPIPPCLMLVSPPRSGSTITYQVLTRSIPCVYISNLHFLFPKYASRLKARMKILNVIPKGFNNYYGYTSSLSDVNEGNEIIESFFIGNPDLKKIRRRFIRFVSDLQACKDTPLIFKNVRAFSKILLLHQAVPELVFLRVSRNLEQVIQSELKAHYELGYFHPIPEKLLHGNIDDPLEFAVHQIWEIERCIDAQKQQIAPEKWIEWTYEDFCSTPWKMMEQLAANYLSINASRLCKDARSISLKVSNRKKVSDQEVARIADLLHKLEKV